MDDGEWLAERFEQHRPRMRAVAYRVLGSAVEADDAVQEAWLRLSRSDADTVDNLPAWLTTVVSRIALNMLRTRATRREDPWESSGGDPLLAARTDADPEGQAVLADSVGLALLVVMDALTPAERLAFVLHDMFDLPFEDIAGVLDRSPAAARQLASRARRRVRGTDIPAAPDLPGQRRLVEAYLAATRGGDLEALVALLHPDVELRADAASLPTGRPVMLRGARTVAKGAVASVDRARPTEPALIDGQVGLVMAPAGRLALVLRFAFEGDSITGIEVIAEAGRLAELEMAVLDDVRLWSG